MLRISIEIVNFVYQELSFLYQYLILFADSITESF